MSVIIGIISFIVVLIVLVVAHELGHFITAKSRGVQVIEFGVGFPPRIWGIKRGETFYSINALPLGGFVKLAGEEDPKVPRSLASKDYGTRILVLAAGSIMNLLLPLLLLSVAFMIPHDVAKAPVTVSQIIPGSQAERAGLVAGDLLVSINDIPIDNTSVMQRSTLLNLNKKIKLVIQHADSSVQTVILTPMWKPPQGQGSTGLGIGYQVTQPYTYTKTSAPFLQAFSMGARECYETLVLFKNEIIRWIIGATKPQVTGPVGMAEMTGIVAKAGVSPVIEFAAFISINLGIVNLLPLPALDGGRIAFVLLEMLRGGRRVSAKTEGIIHTIGFILLIGLMLLVTYGDISSIVTTGSAIP
jgi:regulator of sigma E protease